MKYQMHTRSEEEGASEWKVLKEEKYEVEEVRKKSVIG